LNASRTGVPHQEGHQYNSSEYRYPEESMSVAFPKGYQYLSYMHSQLSKNTTARCQEDCPYFNPERHFRATRARKATLERCDLMNAEHTPFGVDNTLSSQTEYQHGDPEKHYLGRSIGGSCRRAYGHLSTEHGEIGSAMTMQFDKECQHHNMSSWGGVSPRYLGRDINFSTLAILGLLSQCHRMKGISISVPSTLDVG